MRNEVPYSRIAELEGLLADRKEKTIDEVLALPIWNALRLEVAQPVVEGCIAAIEALRGEAQEDGRS